MANVFQQLQDLVISILTQGNTGSASRVKILARKNSAYVTDLPLAVRVQVCNSGTFDDATNATIAAVSGKGTVTDTHQATKDLSFRSQAAVKAAGTLTISGVVLDGQTATIGDRVYEFDAGGGIAGTSDVAADITANAAAAEGTLTVDTQPTVGDSMTIGSRTYVFVASGSADNPGEISRGTSLATAKTAIVAAINGTDNVNTANASVTAADFVADACVLTAIVGGTAGNAIVTTETFAAGTNVFDAATLGTTTAGTACSAANAVTALVAAITGDTSAVVTAADGAGDTVVVTAKTAGTAGNAIATTETMVNGAWGAATLAGGLAQLDGEIQIDVTNATAETVILRFGAAPVGSPAVDWQDTTLEVTHAAP